MAENETFKSLLVIAAGILCVLSAAGSLRYAIRTTARRRFLGVASTGIFSLAALVLIAVGSVWYWYYHRPIPDDITQKPLFEGISYTRDSRSEPRPLVVHVLTIDLDAPGIQFFVTPSEPVNGYQLAARKTSEFLHEFDLQAAVNGSFFEPWWSEAPWNYYPHVGDPVNVKGFSGSQGNTYATDADLYPVLYISADNQVSINTPPEEIFNALAGNTVLMDNGEIALDPSNNSFYTGLQPRTAVCIDSQRETMMLVVVDGRQPNYSEGVSMLELAALMQEFGCYDALNLDGGGSSTMVIEGRSGKPGILNSPIDNHIPGRERPVANHLGIWARPLGG